MASSCLLGKDDLRRSWKRLVLKGQEEKKRGVEAAGKNQQTSLFPIGWVQKLVPSWWQYGWKLHMFSRTFMSLRQAARNTYHRPPLVASLPHATYLVVTQLLKKINREAGAARYCQLNNTVASSTVKYSISQIAGYLHARINLIQQRVSKDKTVCTYSIITSNWF